jgi:DNA-directed RNA polymerase
VAIERVFKGTIELSLTKSEIMQIGKFGVDACFESGMIDTVRGTNKNGTTVAYVLAPEVSEFLHGYTHSDVRNLISKEETRMICPPDPWSNLGDGGYLSIRRKTAAPLLNIRKLRKGVRADVAEQFTAEKMPEVFACGNYLQSTAFNMHGPTRDAIVRVWQSGGGILGVPEVNGPHKPDFPFADSWTKEDASEAELEVFKRWKRQTAAYYTELREWRGRIREVGAFMKATREADGPYWFPVYFDSRGRWYYRGLPNPQGSDLAKAVLHFHEHKPLGKRGLFWLKVHIANSFGFDKERMQDRARWTEQNWARIEAALDAPEDHGDVWGKDAPWCMFAAAWELRAALRSGNPEGYKTGIPVHMDATCSGLQHFSALLRDPVGGLYVNLTDPNRCGPKQDIYSRVAQATMYMVQRDTESLDAEVAELAKWCLRVGMPRALAKKPVMTYVYGATLRGTAEHIEYMLNKELLAEAGETWLDEGKTFEHCMYLAKKLFQGIAAAVPAAAAAMHWLREIAKQQPDGQRMTWTTPTGFIVQHDYQDFTDSKVRLNSCGVVQVWVREWNEGTRAHAMQNAISPNFVHALDASHLTMVANAMHGSGLSMVAIHDSFGTHPCDVDAMQVHIRVEFTHLYSRPSLLAEFLWEVGGIGEPPTRGTLDLTDVLDSEFMFS